MARWPSVFAVLVLLAACSEGGQETTTTQALQTTTQPPATQATTTTAAGVTVSATDTGLGTILTDQEGRTLYVNLNDEQGPSVCSGECEANWPPLLEPATGGEGVDASMLGTAERNDGSVQVTYNGWPLYYFAGDIDAGATNGQGVGDVWWVVSPAGEAVNSSRAGPGY